MTMATHHIVNANTIKFNAAKDYRLLIVGGGAGGISLASRFVKKLRPHKIAIVEPNPKHCYQPGLTLAAAGLMRFEKLFKDQINLIPRNVDWYKDHVTKFHPERSEITLSDGRVMSYDFMVIATGLELRYDLIKGLSTEKILTAPKISSTYMPDGARKTLSEISNFQGGNAIFTFPNTPIKCAGAPQKICYLFESSLKKTLRNNTQISYYTALPRIFGVKKYADSLMKVVNDRGIKLFTRHNLVEVDVNNCIATFERLDDTNKPTGERQEINYSFLHVGPPCSPVQVLRNHAQNHDDLTDENGWVKVSPFTLRSASYGNIFAFGDCANTPNSKTAAAVAAQLKILDSNIIAAIENSGRSESYNGYSSCPLIVDNKHVILAEFTSDGEPQETFPFNQGSPSIFAYLLKRYFMPFLYWNLMLKGYWAGPSRLRKFLYFLARKSLKS